MKIKFLLQIIVVFSAVVSCSITKGKKNTKGVEAKVVNFTSDSLSVSDTLGRSRIGIESFLSNVSSKVKEIDTMVFQGGLKKEMEAKLAAEKNKLPEISKLDSDNLTDSLFKNGSIQIGSDQLDFINKMMLPKSSDTIFLSNIYVTTTSKPISYSYNVNKGDRIFFDIVNVKSAIISKVDVEFIEGKETRYKNGDITKSEKISGNFLIQEDNPLVINIMNDGYFTKYANATIKLMVRRVRAKPVLKVSRKIDSISKNVVVTVIDTLFNSSGMKTLSLPPILDITSSNEVQLPVQFDTIPDIVGWGYWVGLSDDAMDKYNAIATKKSVVPVESFMKSEYYKKSPVVFLPQSTNDEIELSIDHLVEEKMGLNNSDNFGFFYSDSIPNKHKANLNFINKSMDKANMISYVIGNISLNFSKAEQQKIFAVETDSLVISIVK